jgi:hypothetical protein
VRISSKLVALVLLVSVVGGSARGATASTSNLETTKLAKRFGIGFSAGGPLAVLGIVSDVNITSNFSVGMGFGTGLDYNTFMISGRYFLLGEWVSPYLGLAVARWWTDGTNASKVSPTLLADKFLGAGYDYTKGFSVFLLSPSVGVQFMHPMGFAISAEVSYLFRLMDMANGTYAGMSAHWYF